jgi:translin
MVRQLSDGLDSAAADAGEELRLSHSAREVALPACRAVIQASGRSIRATHRGEADEAARLAQEARRHLDKAQAAVQGAPALSNAGFLHDAEKEYAEAVLFAVLAANGQVPGHATIGVGAAAWLNGLAEAASEMRRHLLDTLRGGDLRRAENLLDVMDEVYGVLVTVDYPDAVTGGLRRTTDAFRAVLERTRSDLTTTLLQARLQASIERAVESATEEGRGAH